MLFLKQNQAVNILGIMSGTSLDGVDLALMRYENSKYTLVDFISIAFPEDVRNSLLLVVEKPKISLDQVLKANSLFTKFTAKEVQKFIKNRDVEIIGFSGQTIRHSSEGTLQIGSPGMLAAMTGKTIVGDFRSQDVGAEGQGAPLISFVDELLFRDGTPKILLNIGGIANITFLSGEKDILSFDTGPGNMLIDALMRHLFQKPYDEKGSIASEGKISTDIINKLLQNPYFDSIPPKSTGRADFGHLYFEYFLKNTSHLTKEDKISTATELTICTIVNAIDKFAPCVGGKIIVNGGGKQNTTIMKNLHQRLTNWQFEDLETYGINDDAKEAFAFGILAHHTLMGKSNHVPKATGATRKLILGAIYHG